MHFLLFSEKKKKSVKGKKEYMYYGTCAPEE